MRPGTPPTEGRNPRTLAIDTVPTAEALLMLYAEDALAIEAARAVAGETARAVDRSWERLERGGSVHYFGAGASGRLAVLDATEITPTFGAPPGTFKAHFPGGAEALVDPSIDLEDAAEAGAADAAAAGLSADSVAVGITASGSTPYVAGALRWARDRGALTILVTCHPGASLREVADIVIVADTGPEAIAGSTRLKAGTATKVILNAFSTALMIRAGRTRSNLMIGLQATNAKLRDRAIAILVETSGRPRVDCERALEGAGGDVRAALRTLTTQSG